MAAPFSILKLCAIAFVFWGLINPSPLLLAQTTDSSLIGQSDFAENLFGPQIVGQNYSVLYENLYSNYLTLLNLNTATEGELVNLYILTPGQIAAFLKQREVAGPFQSVYELQTIPGFDAKTIANLLPRVCIVHPENSFSCKFMFPRKGQKLLFYSGQNLPIAQGFSNYGGLGPAFAGSALGWFARYKSVNPGQSSVAILAGKDAGESFYWNPDSKQYGPDFLAGHIMIENQPKFKKLVFGNFRLQAGQGLVSGGGYSPGMGAEPVTGIRKGNAGLIPYQSSTEGGYWQGIGTSLQAGPVLLTLLVSRTNEDASLKTDSAGQNWFSGFNLNGLHRNQAELKNRKTVQVECLGTNAQYTSPKGFQLGLTLLHTTFNKTQQHLSGDFYQQTAGRSVTNVGLSLEKNFRNALFFSEMAWSRTNVQDFAGIGGLILAVGPSADLALLYRNYGYAYAAPYASAFGMKQNNSGENGLYLGTTLRLKHNFTFKSGADLGSQQYLPGTLPLSTGNILFRLSHEGRRQQNFVLQYRLATRTNNGLQLSDSLSGSGRHLFMFMARYPYSGLQMQTRVQTTLYTKSENIQSGFSIAHDFHWTQKQFLLRLIWFHALSYQVRQFGVEPSAFARFSVPAYYGNGLRTCWQLTRKMNQNLQAVLQANTTFLLETDAKFQGSGLNFIPGTTRLELVVQLIIG